MRMQSQAGWENDSVGEKEEDQEQEQEVSPELPLGASSHDVRVLMGNGRENNTINGIGQVTSLLHGSFPLTETGDGGVQG